jgi:hypothetical protein
MKPSTPLLVAGLLVCALIAPASFAAKPTPIHVAYAGFGYDTSYHIIDDAYPVTINLADGKGTFGNTSVAATIEFILDFDMAPNCPSSDYVPFAMVEHDWAIVLTMPDLSQLFGRANEGWICANQATGHEVGFVSGDFTGGIGRFAGAGGSWDTSFRCYVLDPSITLRSWDGSIVGTVEWP